MEPETLTRPERQPAEPLKPVVDPACWRKEDYADPEKSAHRLTSAELGEIEAAVAAAEARGTEIPDVTRAGFPLPTLGPVLDGIYDELIDGRGFAMITGVPVDRYTRRQSAIAFFGIGTYLGKAVSQNAKGHVLGHVKSLVGKDFETSTNRGYQTSVGLPWHGDSCDVVGLLCLQKSKSGGLSKIVSSVTIHNEMLARRPDLAAELVKPWYRDRREEVPEGKKPYFQMPVFNYYQDYLTINYQGRYIRTAQRFDELPRFTEAQEEALAMISALADELCLDIGFEPGDMQFLHNHVALHSRTDYDDYPEPERRRHLLRLWLSTPDGRPLPDCYAERYFSLEPGQRPAGGIIVPGTKLCAPMDAE